ncbi:hypothetical protein BJ322DRAFT_288877 [Thelephora terrestris]|uniref:Uncharacterized protein n=1 Tax=Thelephora terrestris TaxID=56493 RepID=A0A9P6H7M0_9AGAM|nr:hypothetical protein BJ322DRAFT_288877 [Thelephora terrestris]
MPGGGKYQGVNRIVNSLPRQPRSISAIARSPQTATYNSGLLDGDRKGHLPRSQNCRLGGRSPIALRRAFEGESVALSSTTCGIAGRYSVSGADESVSVDSSSFVIDNSFYTVLIQKSRSTSLVCNYFTASLRDREEGDRVFNYDVKSTTIS